jgi:hypothetical protein
MTTAKALCLIKVVKNASANLERYFPAVADRIARRIIGDGVHCWSHA